MKVAARRQRLPARDRWLAYGLLAPAFGAVALLVGWPLWVIVQMSLRLAFAVTIWTLWAVHG